MSTNFHHFEVWVGEAHSVAVAAPPEEGQVAIQVLLGWLRGQDWVPEGATSDHAINPKGSGDWDHALVIFTIAPEEAPEEPDHTVTLG